MVTIMSGYQPPAFCGTFILPSGTWNRSLSKLIARVVCTSHWPESATIEYSPLTKYYRRRLLLFRLNRGILLERFVAKSASGGGCCYLVTTPCLTLCDPRTAAHQAPLSIGFSRQEYWSGLPFPPPGDLPDPGIKPTSPALAAGFFTIVPGEIPWWAGPLLNLENLGKTANRDHKSKYSRAKNQVLPPKNKTCSISLPWKIYLYECISV